MRSWIPYELQLQIEALFPGGGKRIESGLQSAQIDWSRTKAFSEEVRGSVWINLQGRDAQGIVAPGAEYEGLRDQIIAAAADLRDPRTGEALIERAYRREELYHGPHANLEPDVVLEARDTVQIFRKRESLRATTPVHVLSRAEMSRADTSGHHLMNGVLMMYGPGVEAGREIAGAQMQDVAPTVLYAMGLPVPSHMDGQVLRAAFAPSHLVQHPVQTGAEHAQGASDRDEAGSAYSEDEARLVEDRLRGLGYL
jgi:predicted AlkP superfamily phosphohydrolase/phosphomutase